jgi:hypothetical protein
MPNGTINSSETLLVYLEDVRSRYPALTSYDVKVIADTAVFDPDNRLRSIYALPLRERLSPDQVQQFVRRLAAAVGSNQVLADHIYGSGVHSTRGCRPKDNYYCIQLPR